ncbi:hypothetical protein [Paraburkholderia bannensis]|uniref:hypothetical protein n=1 Tax=Paraburkholderia bannensis TaxID=765414 RepID=UPI002AB711F3|nr:hypothetical protein [Paraburkholderia bannensis]
MSEARKCTACGRLFEPRAQSPQQKYCSKPECQRLRKALWQKQKVRTDPDYRENQRRAQKRWGATHPDYWRSYRADHQAYKERNCELQRIRNSHPKYIAKMDASGRETRLCTGFYVLAQALRDDVAKIGAWIVHLTIISDLHNEFSGIAKI